jgi:hypothetical protein
MCVCDPFFVGALSQKVILRPAKNFVFSIFIINTRAEKVLSKISQQEMKVFSGNFFIFITVTSIMSALHNMQL